MTWERGRRDRPRAQLRDPRVSLRKDPLGTPEPGRGEAAVEFPGDRGQHCEPKKVSVLHFRQEDGAKERTDVWLHWPAHLEVHSCKYFGA